MLTKTPFRYWVGLIPTDSFLGQDIKRMKNGRLFFSSDHLKNIT